LNILKSFINQDNTIDESDIFEILEPLTFLNLFLFHRGEIEEIPLLQISKLILYYYSTDIIPEITNIDHKLFEYQDNMKI
jgi:hypothetical protein